MLKIPPRFKQILNKDPKMAGVVMQTMADFGEILEENKLYFFEEYTDHGIRHIQSVLDFSEVLIQEKTWSILRKTPQTVGIYMLAVILHDLGMHITCEGLHALIQGRNDGIRIKSLDNKTWKELWEKYLDEARRFGDKEKTNIIGNKNWNFRTVDLDNKEKLPEPEDRKLIGEFVRRYHPRLAHEFAINGFPAIAENIPFATGLKEELRDICGLIARSHGMEIRDTFDVLEDKFDEGWIRPYNIEVVFLMVVLRIADYCQIDASRVSAISLRLKNFRSPISRTEHYKHEDTPYTQKSPKDPETLLFYCRPRNSLIFIKLKDLFQSLQQELDRSWAILGEIYGKEQGKWSPCIKYRRVRSNIDTPSKFYKNVNYVPERINFAISSDFSKLLIKPLYGNSPTYGVRELIQNAVDACRERAFLEKGHYEGVIRVSFFEKDGQKYFSIEDNGIGMSLGTIKNYYLSIGSSLRVSTQWKKSFLNDEGHSKIQRSGKFGIGVLAAFLLGEKIILNTRELGAKEGFTFETGLIEEQIEVVRNEKKEVGTRIEISISDDIIELLKDKTNAIRFDLWYLQSSPRIIYEDKIGIFNTFLGYKSYIPGYSDKLPDEWYELPQTKFNKVIWSFEGPKKQATIFPEHILACNGILVPKLITNHWKYPFVSVFDFDAQLPLKLNRIETDGPLPFERQLIEDVNRKFIKNLLTLPVKLVFNKNGEILIDPFLIDHPMRRPLSLLLGKKGFIIPATYFLHLNRGKFALGFAKSMNGCFFPLFSYDDIFVHVFDLHSTFKDWMDDLETRLLLTLDTFEEMIDNDPRYHERKTDWDSQYRTEVLGYDIYEVTRKRVDIRLSSVILLSYLRKNRRCIIESVIGSSMPDYFVNTEETLTEALAYYLEGQAVIPYDIEERKKLFPKAFKELQRFFH